MTESMINALQAAYIRLLSLGDFKGRSTLECQAELNKMRSVLAWATGRTDQEVQDHAEEQALLLRLNRLPKETRQA